MSHFDQPVPAFLDSLSSEVELQGAGDQHSSHFELKVTPSSSQIGGSTLPQTFVRSHSICSS